MRIVGLIPARAGSTRVVGKNLRTLRNGYCRDCAEEANWDGCNECPHTPPLVGIAAYNAIQAGIFERIICSTDSDEIAKVARDYGVDVVMRPTALAQSDSPDLDWINHLADNGYLKGFDAFCILRPTSPFRTVSTIHRAVAEYSKVKDRVHSIRAVEPVSEHPYKMWTTDYLPPGTPSMDPLYYWLREIPVRRKYHSQPTQSLPKFFIQTATIEVASTKVLPHSISGDVVAPFFATSPHEFLDINTEDDLILAETLLERGIVQLPEILSTPQSDQRV